MTFDEMIFNAVFTCLQRERIMQGRTSIDTLLDDFEAAEPPVDEY